MLQQTAPTLRHFKEHLHYVTSNSTYVTSLQTAPTLRHFKQHLQYVTSKSTYITSLQTAPTVRHFKQHLHYVTSNSTYITSLQTAPTVRHLLSEHCIANTIRPLNIQSLSLISTSRHLCTFISPIAKLRKTTVSCIMSVRQHEPTPLTLDGFS